MKRNHILHAWAIVVFAIAIAGIGLALSVATLPINATSEYAESYVNYHRADDTSTAGWRVSVNNRNGNGPRFTLWFPDPTTLHATIANHVRYTAAEYGSGEYTKSLDTTYYNSSHSYGYNLWYLDSVDDLEASGITAKEGFHFDHYEIRYWSRDNSTSAYNERLEIFLPDDIMPVDDSLSKHYVSQPGYLEVSVHFAPNTYTITYEDGVAGEDIFETQTYLAKNDTATPTFIGNIKRDGYTFTGWKGYKDFVTDDAVYTAQWEIDQQVPTITLNANNSEAQSPIVGNFTLNDDASFTFPQVIPSREGYIFDGWSANPESDNGSYYPGSTVASANTTYYAIWHETPTYTVTFTDGAEGTIFEPTECEVKLNDNFDECLFTPFGQGVRFTNWRLTGTTTPLNTNDTTVTHDLNLTAAWVSMPTTVDQPVNDPQFTNDLLRIIFTVFIPVFGLASAIIFLSVLNRR